MAFQLMALLVVLKLLAVTVSYGTGNAAASSPSLFIGAMWSTVGTVAHHFSPPTRRLPRLRIVGMGAVFAASCALHDVGADDL